MGIVLRDKNGSFQAHATGMILPIDNTALEIQSVFGGSLSASLRNFAPGKAAHTAIGNPTVNANSLLLENVNHFLQTSMPDGDQITIALVCKVVGDTASTMVVSNYQSPSTVHSGNTNGASLYCNFGTAGDNNSVPTFNRSKNVGGVSTLASTVHPSRDMTSGFKFLCARHSISDGIRRLNNLTDNVASVSAADMTQSDLGGAFRIGSGYQTTTFTGKIEVVAVVGLLRSISDAEMNTLYTFWKGYCTRRGIAI